MTTTGKTAASKTAAKGPGKSVAPRQVRTRLARAKASPDVVVDKPTIADMDFGGYVYLVANASPMEMVAIERKGMPGRLVNDFSRKLGVPLKRLYDILQLPKATAARKASGNAVVDGRSGQAAIAMAKLLAMAETIVLESTSDQAAQFDTAKWLGQWIERPQAALGGRRPADLLDTPTGAAIVTRLLGSIQSGAYQ